VILFAEGTNYLIRIAVIFIATVYGFVSPIRYATMVDVCCVTPGDLYFFQTSALLI
jgi:hypothetical protein